MVYGKRILTDDLSEFFTKVDICDRYSSRVSSLVLTSNSRFHFTIHHDLHSIYFFRSVDIERQNTDEEITSTLLPNRSIKSRKLLSYDS